MKEPAAVSFSGTQIGGWYFVLQAIAIAAWWLFLAYAPDHRALFVPPGAGVADLVAFALPDLAVAAPASLAAGIAILRNGRWGVPLAWLTAGAIAYAFVYCVAWSILRQGGWLNVALMAPAALLSTAGALDASPSIVRVFRRAVTVSPARNLATTLVQIAMFWSFFLAVVPSAIVYVERRLPWALSFDPRPTMAVLVFLVCSALGLVSGITMATRGAGTPLPFVGTNQLVSDGPYGYVRNPMVIAGLGQGLAVALWLGSWSVVAYVVLGGTLWHVLVRPAEERDLHEKFGDEFVEYSRRVRCWVPRLP